MALKIVDHNFKGGRRPTSRWGRFKQIVFTYRHKMRKIWKRLIAKKQIENWDIWK